MAIGTDTPHTHPACDPQALGAATHLDFRLFCTLVSELNDGGVYINAGSAVVMPEVFLKAVSTVRNLGHEVRDFTTVNLDFLQHYRPRVNVVERPHAQAGGRGYSLTGHHEIMIPLLAAALIESPIGKRILMTPLVLAEPERPFWGFAELLLAAAVFLAALGSVIAYRWHALFPRAAESGSGA